MKSTTKHKVQTVRLTQDQVERIEAFVAMSGMKESDALRHLIDKGLMTEGASLYASPLAQFVSELMCSELELFREELARRNTDIENRLAKVTSKGTKSSIFCAILAVDLLRGLYPATMEMAPEEIWEAYWRQAGELQSGKPYHTIKAEMRNES